MEPAPVKGQGSSPDEKSKELPPTSPAPGPEETEEQKKERLKQERLAKMRSKKNAGTLQTFEPAWVSDPTSFQYNAEYQPYMNMPKILPEEQAILNTLLSAKKMKDKIRQLNVETKAEEIQNMYNVEKAATDDLYTKVREIIGRNPQSIIATRRGPVIGMRSMAVNQGLKQEQVLKFFKYLQQDEGLEILYYCFLHKKMKLYPAEQSGMTVSAQQAREQQQSRAKKWLEFKRANFYDILPEFDYLWEELEEDDDQYQARLKADAEANKKQKVEKEKIEVFETEEVVDTQALLKAVDREKVKVFDESREPLVMIFIGHVDSGKSTICGAILQLAGIVNDMEISKLRQEAKSKGMESWYNAYVMDVNDEEKESGKTVEMGRAYFETAHKRFTILDCPGHKNFVQAMLGGAAQADVASLVISAKPGEFESGFEKEGQTREHAMLARALGCQYLVILVNKMDTVNWNEERFKYIKTNLTPFLELNCGFKPECIFWTCLSGLHSLNITEPLEPTVAPWFKSETVFRVFDALPKIKRSTNKVLRIPLLDKFKDMGAIISSCKINSGIVKPNMSCTLMPLQKPIVIAKVLDTMDQELAYAGPGDSVTLHLKGIEEDEIRRGYVICGKQFFTSLCFEFIAEVTVFELLPHLVFGPGFVCMIHLHTALEEVQIMTLDRLEEHEGKVKKVEAKVLRSGQKGIVKFKARNLLCLEKFEEFEELGRFALRKDTITLGSGIVQKYKPAKPELLKNNYYFGQKGGEEKPAETKAEKPKFEAPRMEDGEDI